LRQLVKIGLAQLNTRTKPTRLQDRYELIDELPHVTGGRLFRARDLAFAEVVGVKQLGPGCGLPPEERRQLENTVRHLQCLPHPHLVRLYALDTAAGFLIQEWVQGISLLDLLRRRRGLPASEAMPLVATLPATLDFIAREAISPPQPLLGKLFVQFEGNTATDDMATTPVGKWPPFVLKLNALSLRALINLPSRDDTTHTAIADPRQPTDISQSYGPREFARLLYELLGGRIRELDARRYSPLPALREAGNAVLRRTLLGMPHPDCQSLWADLLEEQPELLRPPPQPTPGTQAVDRTLHIPKPLLAKVQPGVVLRLEPTYPGAVPIRLVARRRFLIGRSAQQADFLARLQPENEVNEALTNRLSRVHTTLEITPDGIHARDGNGTSPSLNGSSLDGQPLQSDPPTLLPHRSLLRLGEEYSLELVPVFQSEALSLPIANIDAWSGPPEAAVTGPSGALVCVPTNGQTAVRQAAWLFTEAGFGLDASEHLIWDTRGRRESPAAFHYHRGCFWLRNRSLPETALTCDGTPLQRNDIAPLAAEQIVRLGSHTFTAHID
jgi:hypothetical protein